MIDLRSDTITRPSREMREAMADAVVGDDVYHDDPTVNELEETVAGLLGKEEAMFVPTGTMSNQIALRMHTQPGDTVVIEQDAHIGNHELGGAAHHSGVTLHRIPGHRGTFSGDDLRSAVPTQHESLPGYLFDPFTLVCAENTHNEAGGTIWSVEQLSDVSLMAMDLGLRRHLDGARIWNAAAATGVDVSTYAAMFDTVSVCFSKGLGAPVGSALVGSHEFIGEARRFKHMFGGGMRQSGIVAAGALFAVTNNRDRLAEDHAHCLAFAEVISEAPGVTVDLNTVETNMVYFEVDDAAQVVDASLANGVSMLALGDSRIRAVFHLDVSDADARKAAEIVAGVAG